MREKTLLPYASKDGSVSNALLRLPFSDCMAVRTSGRCASSLQSRPGGPRREVPKRSSNERIIGWDKRSYEPSVAVEVNVNLQKKRWKLPFRARSLSTRLCSLTTSATIPCAAFWFCLCFEVKIVVHFGLAALQFGPVSEPPLSTAGASGHERLKGRCMMQSA